MKNQVLKVLYLFIKATKIFIQVQLILMKLSNTIDLFVRHETALYIQVPTSEMNNVKYELTGNRSRIVSFQRSILEEANNQNIA